MALCGMCSSSEGYSHLSAACEGSRDSLWVLSDESWRDVGIMARDVGIMAQAAGLLCASQDRDEDDWGGACGPFVT